MNWFELFEDAGLSEREARSLVILSSSKELKASELAKELGTNRLDAYNSLSRLTEIGLVSVTADRRPPDEVFMLFVTCFVQATSE